MSLCLKQDNIPANSLRKMNLIQRNSFKKKLFKHKSLINLHIYFPPEIKTSQENVFWSVKNKSVFAVLSNMNNKSSIFIHLYCIFTHFNEGL